MQKTISFRFQLSIHFYTLIYSYLVAFDRRNKRIYLSEVWVIRVISNNETYKPPSIAFSLIESEFSISLWLIEETCLRSDVRFMIASTFFDQYPYAVWRKNKTTSCLLRTHDKAKSSFIIFVLFYLNTKIK